MKVLWSEFIVRDNISISQTESEGIYLKNYESIEFYFRHHNDVVCKEFSYQEATTCEYRWFISGKKWLPFDWFFDDNNKILVISQKQGIDLRLHKVVTLDEREIERKWKEIKDNKENHETFSYDFGNYSIKDKGTMGYSCYKDNNVVWNFNGRGYLYTSIKKHSDSSIYFGTDGYGGHFYKLNLHTGEVILDIKTGGTNHFIEKDNYIFVLLLGKKGKLLKIDLNEDVLVDEIELPGIATSSSRMYMPDNEHIFVTTFDIKEYTAIGARMSCVSIAESLEKDK